MPNPASAGEGTCFSTETTRESEHPMITSLATYRLPSRFTFGDNSTTIFNFGVVLDPLSESAQKWSSLLQWLLEIPGVSVELRIHPNMYTEVSIGTIHPVTL